MKCCPDFSHLLVLPHLRVQNANAVSSPLTHGFPSMTAFLGLMWALERKAHQHGLGVSFKAVGVVCHHYLEQTTQGGFVNSFCLSRNPVKKDGKTAAIVEEGRIHLELSLIFAIESDHWQQDPDAPGRDLKAIAELLQTMRIAGGSVLPPDARHHHRYPPFLIDLTGNDEDRASEFARQRRKLLPGFTLVSRDDCLQERLDELRATLPEATGLDAWLSLARINWHYKTPESGDKGEWTHDRTHGWLVPIPVGYGALGKLHEAGSVANARDEETPFRFVESLYSMGQWVSPHRLSSPQQMLWFADSEPDNGLYRCRNDFIDSTSAVEISPEPLEFIYD